MKANVAVTAPKNDADWDSFVDALNAGVANPHPLLKNQIGQLRDAGAVSILDEQAYIDRDFSAAYSAFYSTLFRPYRKFCRRLHFFSSDVSPVFGKASTDDALAELEAHRGSYLGSIVLRPIGHSPVSAAYLSAAALAGKSTQEVSVQARYSTHVLGTEFAVDAMPLTQQDTRTGACAQAVIWMAGRHFHMRHSAPWFSMPDITDIAVTPIDSAVTRSLPAGSEWLTQDNMVRALRAMGRHPVVYAPDALVNNVPTWQQLSPRDILARYVDSGVPVLVGMQDQVAQIGHAVIAVGSERNAAKDPASIPPGATIAEFISHFIVNDDQRGAYSRLAVAVADKTAAYPFCVESDVKFLLVPLPGKVFIKAETAEIICRRMLMQVAANRHALADVALGTGSGWDVDPTFYAAATANTLVSRTYLTYGWKYKARALRNKISEHLKEELITTQLPRFVWVTEYSSPAQASPLDPCLREVSAHVVVDATDSQFGENPLILDVPGLSVLWRFDPLGSAPISQGIVRATKTSGPYWPKIRGQMDYKSCPSA